MQDFIKINKDDNVAVALKPIAKGTTLNVAGIDVTTVEDIPQGHKFVIKAIKNGDPVIKYGFRIGFAQADIPVGAWVHTHNLKTGLGELLEYTYEPEGHKDVEPTEPAYFDGYMRENGKVGVRNEVWIVPTVGCVNSIARAIEKQRAIQPIETTFQLVDVIKSALPDKVLRQKGHPAKQTFQALRIEVNDELGALQKGLEEALSILKPNGRCAIITFHSLEDRMVKNVFKEYSSAPYIDPRIPIKASDIKQADYNLITKKPITATDEELDENHRSHSAKLRVIEKKGE